MKYRKEIVIAIGVFFVITLIGWNSVQKGNKKPFRLKESRLAPIVEADWNDEQTKLLAPYTREDGSILNVMTTLAKHPKLFERFIPFVLYVLREQTLPGWSKFDAALIRAVDELYYDAMISDATWKVLSERYNEKQFMDIVFTVGNYNLVSWALNIMGV